MGKLDVESRISEILNKKLKPHSPSMSFIDVWDIYHSRKRKMQRLLVPVMLCAFVLIISQVSPSVRAIMNGWLEVSQVEDGDTIHIGYSWENTAGQTNETFQSLSEVEGRFDLEVPFTKVFIDIEKNEAHKQYHYETNVENNKLVLLNYRLTTKRRGYTLTASKVDNKPDFSAATSMNSVTDKEVIINGKSGRLLAIQDMDLYTLYMEHGEWKVILTASPGGLYGEPGGSSVTEKEMIKLAESISW